MPAKDDKIDVSKLGEKMDNIADDISKLRKVLDKKDNSKKIDDLAKSVKGIDSTLQDVATSKETEVLFKKVDDLLITMSDIDSGMKEIKGSSDLDVFGKKFDDLQQYIAGLSSLEEKIGELSNSFSETKEIVGIIVRQLDDIERKYNQAIDRIDEAVDMFTQIAESEVKPVTTPPGEIEEASTNEKEKPALAEGVAPATIDALMKDLLTLVNPQTEAKEMAGNLEEVRDKLTSLIEGHTPVLFQFGKRARELKSYPPTATLNENDIASLSKDIRGWTKKLKRIAKDS